MAPVEAAVVGAGIVGLSTAYALVERGVEVRLLEAARPGAAQSAGRTRIFRHAHADPELARYAAEARLVWEEWERALGARILGREGVIVTGPQARDRARGLSDAGLPHRLIGPREQEELLPIFRAPGGDALLDALGGSTDVRTAIETLSDALAERLVPAHVFRVGAGEPATIETSEGVWRAARVIVCAGAGTGELTAGLGIDVPMTIGCHARARFRLRRHRPGRPLPSLQDLSGAHGETVYGGPVPGTDTYVVGLSGPDNEVRPGRSVAGLVQRIAGYVRRGLPGIEPDPVDVRLCHATTLPEGGDSFRVWRAGPVLVVAGGNLFKFAPLVGRLLAGAAMGEAIPAWLSAAPHAVDSPVHG